MFEVHGWATIRFTADSQERDDEDAQQDAAASSVRMYVERLDWTPVSNNLLLDLRIFNGQTQLVIAGFKNRPATLADEVLSLFRFIATVAPGSYGLLYTIDDEDPLLDNAFRVLVLARGTLTEHADPFLSPFVPVVESP